MTIRNSISKLKGKLLEIFRKVEASGEEIIVTDHNEPVLRIIPIQEKSTVEELFGHLQGHITYLEDINQPSLEEWEEL